MTNSSQFRAGEWVEVRSKEEILTTLDEHGQLEDLPFMPEMFQFCGKQFQVFKRAHKTCDPPNGLGGRRMSRAVHLQGLRCTGEAHGGCQARCLLFWKDAWLKPTGPNSRKGFTAMSSQAQPGCKEGDVLAGTRRQQQHCGEETVFVCQSTQVAQATLPLPWWDVRQYVEDYTSGNVRPSQFCAALLFTCYHTLATTGLGFGSALRWLYDAVQGLRGGAPYPWRVGKVPRGTKTPSAKLDVRPGEWVKIRPYPEVLETINEGAHNRGMYFDAEMVPFCGGTFRVLDRVTQIVNEKTGKMQYLKNDCIMLDDVVCRSCYSKYRRFCPRSIYAYWREVWLQRTPSPHAGTE
jgi:hypothetical protein